MEAVLDFLGVWGVIAIGIVLVVIAYVGSVLPALPGTIFATLAVVLVHLRLPKEDKYSWITLIIVILLTLIISIVDYVVPIWGTKKFGGSDYGVKGSTIGLIVGVLMTFFTSGIALPLLLLGPFLGAFLGEKYAKNDNTMALKSAIGSFIGFLAGTLGKIIVVSLILITFIAKVIPIIF